MREGLRIIKRLFLPVLVVAGLSPLFAFAQTPPRGRGIEGVWEGALGDGPGQLRLIATISKMDDGRYAGRLDSVDQGAVLPIESAALEGDAVRFAVEKIGGVYRGVLSGDGAELTGTWTQTHAPPQPLSFKRRDEAAAPGAGREPTPKPLSSPFLASVPVAPRAFKMDGRWHLAYELHVVNLSKWASALTRVEILGAGPSRKPLVGFSSFELAGMVGHPGREKVSADSSIGPGAFGIVYMWATFDKLEDVPAAITHRVTAKVGNYPEEISFDGAPVAVDRSPVIVIDPPLRGDDWIAANGPSNGSHHRRALLAIDGVSYISQRYAIDWVERYPDGRTYRGDPGENKNYRAYGAEVFAAADGVVSEIKDGIPQNVPGAKTRAVPITLETIGGNHVLVDLGGGLFAFYAHLQPGSLRVRTGEKIHRGQVLGLLGNTGNSTEPHLHFQICGANSPLASEGIPYAFRSFLARNPSDPQAAPVEHVMEIPGEDEVVRFPPADGKTRP